MGGLYLVLGLILGVASVALGHGNHGHNHGATSSGGKQNTAFQNADIVRDPEHIKEHLSEKIHQKHINQMSPDELQFQFFVAHDLNGDAILDGLEVFKSLEHAMAHMGTSKLQSPLETTKKVMDLTDDVLTRQDLNQDGCLDYREFALGHKSAQPQTSTPRSQL